MRRVPARRARLAVPALAALLAGALIPAPGCDEGDDDDGSAPGCTYDGCLEQCLAAHADELDGCGGICGVDSICLTSGECRCTFYPCHEEECQAWCTEHEGLDHGGCGAVSGNILSCDCW